MNQQVNSPYYQQSQVSTPQGNIQQNPPSVQPSTPGGIIPAQQQQIQQSLASQQPQPIVNSNNTVAPVAASNSNYQIDLDIQNDGLVEPIQKSKELYVQIGNSLKMLLNQLAIILNPANENKIQIENQYQVLGKIIENFNRVCDLFTINLRAAHESQTLSNELKSLFRYYANIGQMDANRNETPYVSSINIQSQRINDFKGILKRFSQINTSINTSNLIGSNLITMNAPTPGSNTNLNGNNNF